MIPLKYMLRFLIDNRIVVRVSRQHNMNVIAQSKHYG